MCLCLMFSQSTIAAIAPDRDSDHKNVNEEEEEEAAVTDRCYTCVYNIISKYLLCVQIDGSTCQCWDTASVYSVHKYVCV